MTFSSQPIRKFVFLLIPHKVITETLDGIPVKFEWKWFTVVKKVINTNKQTVYFSLDCYEN